MSLTALCLILIGLMLIPVFVAFYGQKAPMPTVTGLILSAPRKPWMLTIMIVFTICVCLVLNKVSQLMTTRTPINLYRTTPQFSAPRTTKQPPSMDNRSECFDSPFINCVSYKTMADSLLNNPSVIISSTTKQQHPHHPHHHHHHRGNNDDMRFIPIRDYVNITSLVLNGNSYERIRKFDFSTTCGLPCRWVPREQIATATGVIVDGRFVKDEHFPKKRHPGQLYFLTVLESPLHYQGTLLKDNFKYKNEINLVMTYRVDSNISYFYSQLSLNDAPRKTEQEIRKLYDRKTRTAAWFVSNCITPSKRMNYVRELQKVIDVDIFGECGNKTFHKFGSERHLLTNSYKFYLSFENSFCVDYVTEKFFKLFEKDVYVVPVVRGGTDYDKYFPPDTFINAAWFKTAADLGCYLKSVGNDFRWYKRFLMSRDVYRNGPWYYRHNERLCQVCSTLLHHHHQQQHQQQQHQHANESNTRFVDIARWLSKDMCYETDENYHRYKSKLTPPF